MNSRPADCTALEEPPIAPIAADACRPVGLNNLLQLAWKYEFVRFLVAGGIAAAANLGGAECYRRLLETTPYCFEASIACGFALGTVVSFVLNKFLTFRANDGNTWAQAAKFLLLSLFAIVLSTLVAHVILRGLCVVPQLSGDLRMAERLANVLTIGVMLVVNYVMMRYFAFARSEVRE